MDKSQRSKTKALISFICAGLLVALVLLSPRLIAWLRGHNPSPIPSGQNGPDIPAPAQHVSQGTTSEGPKPPPKGTGDKPRRNAPESSDLIVSPELERARETYRIRYDDTVISDFERTEIITFIGSVVPSRLWPSDTVKSKEDIPALILRRYLLNADQDPRAIAAIIKLIDRENATTLEKRSLSDIINVVIPPIPPKVNSVRTFGPRTLTPSEGVSGIRVLPLKGRLDGLRYIRDISQLASTIPQSLPYDKRTFPGGDTVIMLGTYCDIQDALRRAPYIPPPSVADVSRSDDMVDVVLRSSDRDYVAERQSCEEAKKWLLTLGAQQNVKQLANKLGGSSIAPEILTRAGKDNLVIIDWGGAPHLHGQRVFDVAQFVLLKVLNRPELVDHKYLQYVELDPSDTENGKQLQRWVDEYKENYYKDTNKSLPLQRFEDAKKWITNRGKLDPQLGKRIINLRGASSGDVQTYDDSFPVDQIVLEAALNHFLVRPESPAWAVSLSFSVNWDPDWLHSWQSFRSMIVTAAVNDRISEPPGEFPQGLNPAANFVTVTTGNRDGLVLGGHSLFAESPEGRTASDPIVAVHVLAPGCGYDYDLIDESDFGTSFATPFVAVFTWAEHLANGTKSQRARDTLIGSSEMRLREIPISSNGVFEPAFISAGSGAWYATYDSSSSVLEPSIFPIASGSIHIKYVDDKDTEQEGTLTTRHICSLSLFADDQGKVFVRYRDCKDPKFAGTFKEARVSSCTLSDSSGSYLSICKEGKFQAPAKNTLLQVVFNGQDARIPGATP